MKKVFYVTRILSVLICFLFLMSMTVMTTFADEADDPVTTFSALQAKIQSAKAGTVIELTADLTEESSTQTLTIPEGANVMINLNGHTIDRKLVNKADDGAVFTVKGVLTILDSSGNNSGTVKGGFGINGGGVYVAANGKFVLKSGTIADNQAKEGGGVYVAANGSMVMEGGLIKSNHTPQEGGGICNYGNLVIEDGRIEENDSTRNGGGISNYGTLQMNKGSVYKNTATYYGGGIHNHSGAELTSVEGRVMRNNTTIGDGGGIYNDGTLTISGGQTSFNTAAGRGGGILLAADGAVFNVQADPSLFSNTAASGNNFFLLSGARFTLTDALNDDARLSLVTEDFSATITSGLEGKGQHYNFVCENSDYRICLDTDGEAYVGTETVTVSFDAGGLEGTMDSLTFSKGLSYTIPEPTYPHTSNKVFMGWNKTTASSQGETLNAGDVVRVFEDMTLTAVWEDDFVSYMDLEGFNHTCDVFRRIEEDTVLLDTNWCIADTDVTVSNRLKVPSNKTVNLILGDDAKLDASKGIHVPGSSTLIIWVQSYGSNMGTLVANGDNDMSGIGGSGYNYGSSCGTIIINGGNITATGGRGGAGIGGGDHGSLGSLTINAGNVTANGGFYGAGIGGGSYGYGGSLTINGGTVSATGNYGAAIGPCNITRSNEDTSISIAEGYAIVVPAGGYITEYEGGDAICDYSGSANPANVVIQKDYYTVSFDGGGAEGSMKTMRVGPGIPVSLPACGFTAPGEKVTFKGWQIDEDEENLKNAGDEVAFEADTIVKAVWEGKIDVTIDFGADHEQFVAQCYEEYWEADGYTINSDCNYKVSYEVDYGSTVEEAIGEFDLRIGMTMEAFNGRKLFGILLNDRDYYHSYSDIMQDENVYAGLQAHDGLSLFALWFEPVTEGSITVQSPLCGTEVTIIDDDYETPEGEVFSYKRQNPLPEVTFEGQLISYSEFSFYQAPVDGRWVENSGTSIMDMNPFLGTMEGGSTYYVLVEAYPAFGYYIDYETIPDILTVNGQPANFVDNHQGNTVAVLTGVTARHEYDSAEYVWSEDNSSVTATHVCSACGEAASETAETTYVIENGTKKYTAVFEDPSFAAQTKTVLLRTVTFDAGNGYGSMDAVNVGSGEPYQLPECLYTAPDGLVFQGWQEGDNTDELKAPGESVTINEDTVFTARWIISEPAFKTYSLVLSGRIGLTFYMDLPQIEGLNYADSYMEFTISGKDGETTQVPFSEAKMNNAGTYYGFVCYTNAIQMADTVTATFHYGDNKTVQFAASVMDYLENAEAQNGSDALKNLYAAIKDYGYYSQQFLSENRGWTIGTDHAAIASGTSYSAADYETVKNAISAYAVQCNYGNAPVKALTASLVLDSETAINLYIRPREDYEGEVTACIEDSTENAAVKMSDGRYSITIPNISAHNLGKMYTVSVTMEETFDINISALSYAKIVLDGSSSGEKAKNNAAALYYYYEKSMAYLDSLNTAQNG